MKCYLCRCQMQTFIKKNGYEIWDCPNCGFKSTDLHQDYKIFVQKFYSQEYFTGDPTRGAYFDYKRDKPYIVRNMKKVLTKIKLYKRGGRLLDVGCAMGFFVELALDAGFDAYGIDPSHYAISNRAENLNGRLQMGTVDTIRFAAKSFDVITMLDVIEHLPDPRRVLKKALTLLKDDGIVVIATGDTDSVYAKIFKRRWTFYNPPQHLHFFSRRIFLKFLLETGFKPLTTFIIGKWLSLRYVLHLAKTGAESIFAGRLSYLVKKIRIDWLPLFLPARDNFVVIARKTK